MTLPARSLAANPWWVAHRAPAPSLPVIPAPPFAALRPRRSWLPAAAALAVAGLSWLFLLAAVAAPLGRLSP